MGRILIADPNPTLRVWIAAGLQCPMARVSEAESGLELLWQLTQQAFRLVVVGPYLDDIAAPDLLAMARNENCALALRANKAVPFLLVLPFCSSHLREAVHRMGPAEVVDDWTDTAALRAGCERVHPFAPASEPDRDRFAKTHRRGRVLLAQKKPPMRAGTG